jgi:glutathione S-transferase
MSSANTDTVLLLSSLRGRTPDQELIKKHLEQLDDVLKVYNGILAKQRYVVGDDFTLVDIFHGPLGWLVQQGVGAKELFEKYPNVQRWWKDIMSRESFRAVEVEFP